VSVYGSVRALLETEPGIYERVWLASINVIGVIVFLAVVFDSSLVIGHGQSGVFQRALYPLVPPAVTLGVAVAIGKQHGILFSAGVLIVYTAVLATVGTVQSSLVAAPEYVVIAVIGIIGAIALGYGIARKLRS
jgi:hypothetical protein